MFPIGGSAGWAGQVCAKVDFARSPGEIEMRLQGHSARPGPLHSSSSRSPHPPTTDRPLLSAQVRMSSQENCEGL